MGIMFLKDLQLTNFRCHRKLYINFEDLRDSKDPIRKTTFLLGENGTGKSALLKAIALVTAGSSSLGDLLRVPDEWVRNGTKNCEISATLMTAEGKEREIKLCIERGSNLRKILEQNKESLDLIDRAIAHADRNYFVVGYGASRRLNRDDQFFSFRKGSHFQRSANVLSLFNGDAQLVSLSNWAMDLDYTGKGDGLKTVKRALDSFLVENVRFKHIDREKKQLVFTTPDGDLPLSQLSDGYQNVASWVGDLMYRVTDTFKDFKDPLRARGLLLIDEIDLHLHPRWQRRLHEFLRVSLPNFQVIATTHSPLTAQQANEHELYSLRREGKDVELIAFNGSPNKMLLHQLLMSPVFGLESDESLEVQMSKNRVREIELKKDRTTADAVLMREIEEELAEAPINLRANSLLSMDDLKLLEAINDKLKSNK